jgi:hypothetical protein
MIQTMYNKVFPQEVYSQFGLTIIDEVHRIGSEEFSKTLLKTITPYMLGISATVERKDKLTKLLYMFIGPKIHSMLRKQEDTVCVRGIEFLTNDSDFNEVEYDFRGQPKYSTMISKICAYGPRSDFIVKTIKDLLKENPEGQIMVLAHNRSLLTYLYECLNNAGVNTLRTPPVGTEPSATGGRAGGEAPALMDTIHINSSIEDRIRILSAEMIKRGLETEESLKRLRSYEKKRNDYRCLMEELARYYDRQTALDLPIERPVLKTGIYMQHIMLL